MTYPLSNEVNVGDATEASQYNNLRRDALYLGGDPAGSGTLLQLLSQGMGRVSLTMLSASTIQLSASESNPCALVINGTIRAVTSDISLMLNGIQMSSAGRYFLYAVGQQDGSFTLSAGTSGPDNSRQIGTFLWDGYGMIPGTLIPIGEYAAVSAVNIPRTVNGRLTYMTGNPVPEADVTSADTLYFTPYGGNMIGLPVGTEWELFSFSELSMSLSGLTNELPYDIFIGADRNGLSLSSAPWGSASARVTSLVYRDGVPVSAANMGLRYLGTIVKNAAGRGEDSAAGRLLWNQYNRVQRPLLCRLLSTGAGTFQLNEWAPYFSDNEAPAVRMLVPSAETEFELSGTGITSRITEEDVSYMRFFMMGIGKDPMMASPYTGNDSCVPVYARSNGNSPVTVSIRNYGTEFRGYHNYVLLIWTNYTFRPMGVTSSMNDTPGLCGYIMG